MLDGVYQHYVYCIMQIDNHPALHLSSTMVKRLSLRNAFVHRWSHLVLFFLPLSRLGTYVLPTICVDILLN